MQKQVQVEAKTLKLHLKVRDEFTAKLVDQDGETLRDYEGYVPSFMPGQHFGDYVILDIDLDSGQILNWKAPSSSEIQVFVTPLDE